MSPDRLNTTFAALADPTRRAILARLIAGETTVTALAEPFEMSLPAISKHLKVLERAGLIARGREAQWRPCRLAAGPLKDAADWIEDYRKFWEQSFERLDDYLRELQKKEKKYGRKNFSLPLRTGKRRGFVNKETDHECCAVDRSGAARSPLSVRRSCLRREGVGVDSLCGDRDTREPCESDGGELSPI